MTNPFTFPLIKQTFQALGRNLTQYCNKCNANRFDLVIDNLIGAKNNLCFKCRFQRNLIKLLLIRWFKFYNFDYNTLVMLCKNPTMRKLIKNIFKGMGLFGLQKPFITGAPLSVVWNYTKKCNLRCAHCFSDSKFNQKSDDELTTNEAKQVINILAANDVLTVNFCGGEPLMREDLFEIIQYTNDKGIFPSLSTNATLLTKDICQKLYDAGIRDITISLDGISSKSHEHLRNVLGTFEKAVNGIKNAVEFGKFEEIIVNTTLLNFNYDEIPDIYKFIKELGATGYYVSRILPTGRGKDYLKHSVSNDVMLNTMKFMAKKFIQNALDESELLVYGRGMPYFSRACFELSNGDVFPVCEILTGHESKYQEFFDGNAAKIINELYPFFSGCATGLFYCGLDCDGNILPCAPAGHIKLGKILEKGLSEIWIKSPVLNKIRQRNKINGKCSKCKSKVFCGGCRLTAYGLTGDWLGSDLSCPY
ncbi:MAG: radical SAM protein [Candidatus Hodarchaeota archaeon]